MHSDICNLPPLALLHTQKNHNFVVLISAFKQIYRGTLRLDANTRVLKNIYKEQFGLGNLFIFAKRSLAPAVLPI